jgi:hypothetical protein
VKIVEKTEKRKKTYVLIAIALIVIIGISLGLYGYSYIVVSDALRRSLETMKITDFEITGFSLFPPALDFKVVLTIENPTGTSITLRTVYVEVFLDGSRFGEITAEEKYLPAGGLTTLEGDFHIGAGTLWSVFQGFLAHGSVRMRVTGRIVASATYLFVTITHEFPIDLQQEYSIG